MAATSRVITGSKQLQRKLANMAKPAEARKVVRPGVAAAARHVRDRARANVPKDSGALRMSIGVKQKTDRRGVLAIVGPRLEYLRGVVSSGGSGTIVRPFKYAHIIEFGSVSVAPQPFMRPAYNAAMARRIVRQRAAQEIVKLARKKVGV